MGATYSLAANTRCAFAVLVQGLTRENPSALLERLYVFVVHCHIAYATISGRLGLAMVTAMHEYLFASRQFIPGFHNIESCSGLVLTI